MLVDNIRKLNKIFVIALVLFWISPCVLTGAGKPNLLDHEFWEIKGKPGKLTWVILHNRKEAKQSGIVHIEIIARKKGDPAWKIEHVCNHMAITVEALTKSTLRPLTKGGVYPESFNNAYAEWEKQAWEGTKEICTTSIMECLP
jgi:Domain of unknown function (DUF5086)